ncbi:CoA transferase [Streptomyces sp. CBMA29]|uniref:CoA transferase n=1 Tax=Streptomyces sp. CBMA29 TaxID=1896314 RepID=UPI00166204BC|nr:CoA transferase [Streptomyces sp. CBMA29]MBD0738787.1 carnitine dehydratase [Streptomyces sp. CBMA29]
MRPLEARVRDTLAAPATSAAYDIDAALDDVLEGVGLHRADSGGRIDFAGADPVVPSPLRLAGAAGIALVGKSVAIAALHRDRGGPGQDIAMDLRVAPHRLCPFYDRRWELLDGYPVESPVNRNQALGLSFHRTADDRWVMPLNPYPGLKVAAQRLLDCADVPEAVARAVRQRTAAQWEAAGERAGVVLPMVRTVEEFLACDHFTSAVADAPLVEIERVGDSDPEPFPDGGAQPLDGVRALGMGHVIAGAGLGRALALHGADVLNVWRPDEFEHDGAYASANVGVRSCRIDPRVPEGRSRVAGLLRGADVFFANRRPGYLESTGADLASAVRARPGLVHATISYPGTGGPWAGRVGFDQSAGAVTGMADLEGDGGVPSLSPVLVVNDYIAAWLGTLGVVQALRRRAAEGGSWRVHVSLVRTAAWILGLGLIDPAFAREHAGRAGTPHAYLDPEVFTAPTPLGHYQGVTDQVRMSRTPGRYREVLVARGSCAPAWLPRGR